MPNNTSLWRLCIKLRVVYASHVTVDPDKHPVHGSVECIFVWIAKGPAKRERNKGEETESILRVAQNDGLKARAWPYYD